MQPKKGKIRNVLRVYLCKIFWTLWLLTINNYLLPSILLEVWLRKYRLHLENLMPWYFLYLSQDKLVSKIYLSVSFYVRVWSRTWQLEKTKHTLNVGVWCGSCITSPVWESMVLPSLSNINGGGLKQQKNKVYWRWKNVFEIKFKVVPYTSGKIWSAHLIFLYFWQCVWIYPL